MNLNMGGARQRAGTLLDLIGNTPMVKLTHISPENVEILAKLEMFNPSGSIKDRVVKAIVEEAERSGKLNRGDVIVEATSGNTGIALAMLGTFKGYKVKVVMPRTVTPERRKIIEVLGGEVILVDDEYEAIRLAKELSESKGYFLLNQFENRANVEVHYKVTAEEILQQAGQFDVLVSGIGTGGTITGVAKRLKEEIPSVRIVGVEPSGEGIDGLLRVTDSNYRPPVLDLSLVDELIEVTREEALRSMKRIISEEGLFVGLSSGAAIHAALKVAEKLGKGRIVVIFPDSGFRYLSML